jgi:hypothetical protein
MRPLMFHVEHEDLMTRSIRVIVRLRTPPPNLGLSRRSSLNCRRARNRPGLRRPGRVDVSQSTLHADHRHPSLLGMPTRSHGPPVTAPPSCPLPHW